MQIAQILSILIAVYAVVGIIFGIYFVLAKAHVIDPAAKGAGFMFRVLIFFGSAALWPLLLGRAFGDVVEPTEVNSHREMAGGGND